MPRNHIDRIVDLFTCVRRDGRVLVSVSGVELHVGAVERKDTHDGKAWFWSRDGFNDEALGGTLTRRECLKDMLSTMAKEAK